jgi:hypothetical protein
VLRHLPETGFVADPVGFNQMAMDALLHGIQAKP